LAHILLLGTRRTSHEQPSDTQQALARAGSGQDNDTALRLRTPNAFVPLGIVLSLSNRLLGVHCTLLSFPSLPGAIASVVAQEARRKGTARKKVGESMERRIKKHISYTARKPGSIEWQLLESKLSPNYDTSQPLSCPGRESPSPTWAVWKTILSLPSFGAKKLSLGTRLREERHHQRQRPNGACKKPGCPVVLKSSQSSFSSIGPCSW